MYYCKNKLTFLLPFTCNNIVACQAHPALVIFAYVVSRWVVLILNCPVTAFGIVHLLNGIKGQGAIVRLVVSGF